MEFQNWRWYGFQCHGLRVEFHNRTIGAKASRRHAHGEIFSFLIGQGKSALNHDI
jgi:hypothetical protein